MNTTGLIREWSMQGARRDFQARFEPLVDILGVLGSGASEQVDDAGAPSSPSSPSAPSASATPLLVKGAGGGEWQPLPAGV